jgi:hypothetical protein
MTTQIVTTEVLDLARTKAPALPIAPVEYSRQYIDQLNNVLRLYFSQLDNFVGQLSANGSNTTSNMILPYGAFQDNQDQFDGNTSTVYYLTYDTTDYSNGVHVNSANASFTATISNGSGSNGTSMNVTTMTSGQIYAGMKLNGTGLGNNTRVIAFATGTGNVGTYVVSDSLNVTNAAITGTLQSRIMVDYTGLYNIQFSVQVVNTSVQIHDVEIWFRKNGVDIPKSNSKWSVPNSHGGVDGHLIAALNYFIDLDTNDYLEIMWYTNDSSISLQTLPPSTGPTRPLIPSVIMTASFVSAI